MAESTAPAAPTPPRPRSSSQPGSTAVAPAPAQTDAAPAAAATPATTAAPEESTAAAEPAVEGPSEEEISQHAIESGSGRTMIVMHLGSARAEINPRAVRSHLERGFVLGEPTGEVEETPAPE